ncbi:MAG: GH32 C-terminal domain-containing protein [Gammaproteobacteria bacterium]|nr:GH32 C-terminal domain-containing protein [Gammaproteobacteria bacterium]
MTTDTVNHKKSIKNLIFLAAILAVVAFIVFWVDGRQPSVRLSFDSVSGAELSNDADGSPLHIHGALTDSRFDESGGVYHHTAQCVSGGCLQFDGYATYIGLPTDALTEPGAGFTVRVWLAPQLRTTGKFEAIFSQHETTTRSTIDFGIDPDGRWGLRTRAGINAAEILAGEDRLSVGRWTQLTARYDSTDSSLSLYRDGVLVIRNTIDAYAVPRQWNVVSFIGRSATFEDNDSVFASGAYAGVMDQFELYANALPEERIVQLYEDEAESVNASSALPTTSPVPATAEIYRPQFHANARAGWTDRPMAPLYYKGLYHLFYLTNPQGPFPGRMHWGHWTSVDMVNWQEQPLAMSPTLNTDFGIGAGTATLDSVGDPVIFYNLVFDPAKPHGGVVMTARPTDADLLKWRSEGGSVFAQMADQGSLGDFNDPFVFKSADGERWFALVGGRTTERSGTVMVYESTDFKSWEHKGEMFGLDRKKYARYGSLWSSPVLLPLGKDKRGRLKHALIAQTEGRTHPTVSYYWVGRWNEDKLRFTTDYKEPRRIDISRTSMLAPTGFVDPVSGRSILYYFFDSEDTPQLRSRSGWANSLGIPLELSLGADDSLRVAPLREMSSRRGAMLADFKDSTFAQVRQKLYDLNVETFEIDMVIDMASTEGARTGFILRRDPKNVERTIISWDQPRKLVVLQRNLSSLDPDTFALSNIGSSADEIGDELRVRLFVDRSSIEAFFDDRHLLFGNIYPAGTDSKSIALLGSGNIKVSSFQMWAMSPAAAVAGTTDSTDAATGTTDTASDIATSSTETASDTATSSTDTATDTATSASGATTASPVERLPAAKWLWTSILDNHDFSSCTLDGWEVIDGQAFHADAVVNRSHFKNELLASFNPARRIPGLCHFWGALSPGGSAAIGQMRSASFKVESKGTQLNFLIAGGQNIENLYAGLIDIAKPDTILMRASGVGHQRYRRVFWDLSPYVGRTLAIKVVDNDATPHTGYLNLDSFNLSAPPDATAPSIAKPTAEPAAEPPAEPAAQPATESPVPPAPAPAP